MAPWLLELVACPACDERPQLLLEGAALVCPVCGRRYPIVDGVPRLWVEADGDGVADKEAHGDTKP